MGDYAGVILAAILFYIRASVIGVKYGCYGEKNWNRVKTEEIPSKEIFGNLTLVKWLGDLKDQILLELMASELRRNCFGHPGTIHMMPYDEPKTQFFKAQIDRTISDYSKTLKELNDKHK